jgi:hypothetical protein
MNTASFIRFEMNKYSLNIYLYWLQNGYERRIPPGTLPSFMTLKVHKRKIFLGSHLNFVLFYNELCLNIKVLLKNIDWTIFKRGTIISKEKGDIYNIRKTNFHLAC